MLFISNNGNVDGVTNPYENTVEYIDETLNLFGCDVKVEVQFINGQACINKEKVPDRYIEDNRIWFHCKNIEVLDFFKSIPKIKYFWHEHDDYSMISNKKIWTRGGAKLTRNSVCYLPRTDYQGGIWEAHAICTDDVFKYQKMYSNWNNLQNLLI